MIQSFIGLEIHIHLKTQSKMFCSCKAGFGDKPNTNICPVCMGYPGTLPVLNEHAVRLGMLAAMALECTSAESSVMERKNYFYPDMPKNYQISQFGFPIGKDGWMEFETGGTCKRIRIHDVHLEEDAGKMMHLGDMTLLDDNRAGYPLLEIVTEPDFQNGTEVEAFLLFFRQTVRYLGLSDGNMEEGSLKCDANVSINWSGKGLGTKVEIKNLNSSRFVHKALDYEIRRQIELLKNNQTISQETRLWNENRDVTEVMRTKESSHDYRYFPEPDIPPYKPDAAFLASTREMLTELPLARVRRLAKQYNLPQDQAERICEEKDSADFFESAAALYPDAAAIASWLCQDIQKILNRSSMLLCRSPFTPERLAQLLQTVDEGKISGKTAKTVLELIFTEDKAPLQIIAEHNFVQISDTGVLESQIQTVLQNNPKACTQYKQGDQKVLGFFIGEVMKASKGQASPSVVTKLLKEKLDKMETV